MAIANNNLKLAKAIAQSHDKESERKIFSTFIIEVSRKIEQKNSILQKSAKEQKDDSDDDLPPLIN